MARRARQISPALMQATEALRRDEAALNVTGGEIPRHVMQQAADMVAPMIRDMLAQNMRAAGIKTDTGKLMRAIMATRVYPGRRGLVFRYPSGISPYTKGGKKSSDFYAAAGALHEGSVRVPKRNRMVVDLPTGQRTFRKNRDIVGERAKRTIKKIASGVPVSDRARRAVASGRKIHGTRIPGISVGQATVTPARPFYRLTEAQRLRVRTAYLAAVRRLTARRKAS